MMRFAARAGLTLIELLIFLGITSAVSIAVLMFLISAQEGNSREQALLDLERGGAALLQAFTYHMRHAERIITPALGSSGRVLTLQTADPETDPTILGQQGNGFVIVERDTSYDLIAAGALTVEDLVIANTSADTLHPSAQLSVTLSRRPAVPNAEPFVRTFTVSATAFPVDIPQGNACGCAAPSCTANGFQWEACDGGICQPLIEEFQCP